MRQDEGEEHDNWHDAHLQHLGQHEHGEEHHEDMLSHPHLASLSTSLFLFPMPYMKIFIFIQNTAKEVLELLHFLRCLLYFSSKVPLQRCTRTLTSIHDNK